MTKGKKEQTALFPIHPLYKVATSITFQNVWDHFPLFSTQQKFLVILGDRFEGVQLPSQTHTKETGGRKTFEKVVGDFVGSTVFVKKCCLYSLTASVLDKDRLSPTR
jgi:hypothetical protein